MPNRLTQSLSTWRTSRQRPTGKRTTLFVSCDQQVANVRAWNEEFQWGFTADDFERLPGAPEWPTGHLQVVVLVPWLGLTNSTASVLWTIASRQQRQSECYNSNHPSTWTDYGVPAERGLAWSVIDLGYDVGVQLGRRTVPDRALCAGVEVVAAAAHFPRWVRAIDLYTIPNVVLAGLDCNGSNVRAETMPLLYFGELSPVFGLSRYRAEEPDGRCSYALRLDS